MTVITISGKAESGKDTTATILKEQLEDMGYSVLITHYADLLKYICKQFFGWDGKKNEEGRTLLQKVGTETVRTKKPEYWVDFIKSILELFDEEWDFVLIPDTRFPNEIESMKDDFDCLSLYISRPNYENHLTEEQRNHPSETALDDYYFDHKLINPGDLAGLTNEIKTFINHMFEDSVKKTLIDKIKDRL
jgi:hypothetical protein